MKEPNKENENELHNNKREVKMNKIIKVAAIATTLTIAGACGLGYDTYASQVPLSTLDTTTIQLCQTVTADYDEAVNTVQYTVSSPDSIMGGSGTYSINDTGCTTIDLSSFYFANDDQLYEGVLTVVPTAPSDLTSTGISSYDLHFRMINVVDASGNITSLKTELMYITEGGNSQKKDSLAFSYTKNYAPTHIELSKTVKGAAGNTNEEFSFTVHINGTAGTNYVVKNNTTNTTSSCAAATDCTVTLKHGQTVTIGLDNTTEQIAVGTTYTITENNATDYKTYINDSTTEAKATGQKTAMPEIEDNSFAYVNRKDSEVVTGIVFSLLPYALLAAISAGLIISAKKTAKE